MNAGASALHQAADKLRVALTPGQITALLGYRDMLLRWNRTYNLTAVRDADAMLVQHVVDCLAVLPPLARACPQGGLMLDVGSGGGLPGVVVAVAAKGWQVVCVDAVAKKSAFVRQVAAELVLPNLRAVHGRVEEIDPVSARVVTSRAFSTLADFASLTLRHLATDGLWMAMKGKTPAQEIASLPSSVHVFHVEQLQVPLLDAQRCLVWMKPAEARP